MFPRNWVGTKGINSDMFPGAGSGVGSCAEQVLALLVKKILPGCADIMEKSKEGKLEKHDLINYRQFLRTPTKHVSNNGYVTYVSKDSARCASLLTLRAVDGTLTDRRKNEELSELRAKRRKLNGERKKRNGVPTTTRGLDGLSAEQTMDKDNENRNQTQRRQRVKDIEKRLKTGDKLLTDFDDLLQRMTALAIAQNMSIGQRELWEFTSGKFKTEERKILLRLCAPDSKVLSKKEPEQLKVLIEERVTYLGIMSSKEKYSDVMVSLRNELLVLKAADVEAENQSDTEMDDANEDSAEDVLSVDDPESVVTSL